MIGGIAAALALGFTTNASPQSQLQRDNEQTDALYYSLQQEAGSSQPLSLGQSNLGPSVATLFSNCINQTSILLVSPTVSLTPGSNDTRSQIDVVGKTTLRGYNVNMTGTIKYVDGIAHVLLVARVLTPVNPAPKSSLNGPPPIGSMPLSALDPSVPTTYSDIQIDNVAWIISSHDAHVSNVSMAPAPVLPGLWALGNLSLSTNKPPPTTGNETWHPQLDIVRAFFDVLMQRLNATMQPTKIAALKDLRDIPAIIGSLWPTFNINLNSQPDQQFVFDEYLVFNNWSVSLFPLKETVNVSAVATASFPGFSDLVLVANGSADLSSHTVSLSFNQTGAWALPGIASGMSVDKFSAVLTAKWGQKVNNITQNMSFTGMLQAGLEYGNLKGFAKIQMPPPVTNAAAINGTVPFAVEATFSDSFSFSQLPAVSSNPDFPVLLAVQSVLVFSPVAGTYTFASQDNAPMSSMKVVHGLSLVANLDTSSSGLAALPLASAALVVTGAIDTDGSFRFSGVLSGLVIDDDLLLNSTNLTISSTVDANHSRAAFMQLSVKAVVMAGVVSSDPLLFTLNGSLSPQLMSIQGDLDVGASWELDIGSVHFGVKDIGFSVVRKITQCSAAPSTAPTTAPTSVATSVATAQPTQEAVSTATPSSTPRLRKPRLQVPCSQASLSGKLSGVINVNGIELSPSVTYPFETDTKNKSCANFGLDLAQNYTLGMVLTNFLPFFQAPASAPSGVVADILNTALETFSLHFWPECHNLSLSFTMATRLFGPVSGGLTFHRNEVPACSAAPNGTVPNCTWSWLTYVSVAPGWQLASSSLVSAGFPQLILDGTTFILSNSDGTVIVPVNAPTINLNQNLTVKMTAGLNVHAYLSLAVNPDVASVAQVMQPDATVLEFIGDFHQSAWSMEADLRQGSSADLGHGFVLTKAGIRIFYTGNSTGGFCLFSNLQVPNPVVDSDTLEFDVLGEVDALAGGNWKITFQGDVHDASASLPIPLGVSGVAMNDLLAKIVVQRTNTTTTLWNASIHGDFTFPPSQGMLLVNLDLMSTGLKLNGTMVETPPLNLGDIVDQFCGSGAWSSLALPQNVKDGIDHAWALESMSVAMATSPNSINGSGAMMLFGMANLRFVIQMYKNTALPLPPGAPAWASVYAAQLSVGSGVPFSTVLPSVTSLDTYSFATIMVAISNIEASVLFPGLPVPYAVHNGFNFMAALLFRGSGVKALETIASFTGVYQASVSGVIVSEVQFELHADLQGDINLFNLIHITAVGFLVRQTVAEFAVGFEASVNIAVTKRPQDLLHFAGDFLVSEIGFRIDVAMTQDWVTPFGIPGFTIQKCALALEISYALVPTTVGVGGGLVIGPLDGTHFVGTGDVYIDENAVMLYGSLQTINLQIIVDTVLSGFGVSSPPSLLQTLTNMNFGVVTLYVNQGTEVIRFNGQTWPPGFMFSIQNFNLWNLLQGSASLAIVDNVGLDFNATLAPVSLLGGLIVIHGALRSSDPATAIISIHKGALPKLNISGGAGILGNYLGVAALMDDTYLSLYVDMSVLNALFEFKLNCTSTGPPSRPTDFSVWAAITNGLQTWIENQIPARLQSTQNTVDSSLSAARRAVQSAEDSVDSLQSQIDAIKAEDQAGLSPAMAALANAQSAVANAQGAVDSLQNQINDLENKINNLPWYLKWEAVGYGTAIAGLETAKGTAWLTLKAAEGVLDACQATVSHLQEVDPRVLALEAAKGTADGVLEATKATLSGSMAVYNTVNQFLEKMATWTGEVVNIQEIDVSGSLTKMLHGDFLNLHVKGIFLGDPFDITVNLDVASVASYADALWGGLVSFFHLSTVAANKRLAVELASGPVRTTTRNLLLSVLSEAALESQRHPVARATLGESRVPDRLELALSQVHTLLLEARVATKSTSGATTGASAAALRALALEYGQSV